MHRVNSDILDGWAGVTIIILLVATLWLFGWLFIWTLDAFQPQWGNIRWTEAMEKPIRPWARLAMSMILAFIMIMSEGAALQLWLRRR